jgi:3-deoxy-D-manno-octulosonic acid kinase
MQTSSNNVKSRHLYEIINMILSHHQTIALNPTLSMEEAKQLFIAADKAEQQSASCSGRGAVRYFDYQGQSHLLRHYHRGGWMAHFNQDRYVYLGLKKTRPWQEGQLLLQLHRQQLPVPFPAAARIIRCGLCYRADLIMHTIAHAQNLVQHLKEQALSNTQWQQLGKLVRHFHQQGVYHADLNAHNILVDKQEKIWLIDFDKGKIIQAHTSWQQQNLARLKRSLDKEKDQHTIHFDNNAWQCLMTGYQSTRT